MMKQIRRTVLVTAMLVSLLGTGLLPGTSPASAAVNYQSFQAEGTVSNTDIQPSTSAKEGFALNPVTSTNGGVNSAKATDGSLSIEVTANTKYYKQDAVSGQFKPATYDEAVALGNGIRAAGKYANVNGNYQLIANYVWFPPKNTPPVPANPQPSGLGDFNLTRGFNVNGFVSQTGAPEYGVYSTSLGWVMNNITEFNNAHVAAIAAHHSNKLIILDAPYTKYYVEDPVTGLFHQKTKADAIQVGNEVRAAGRYMWNGQDWAMYASYVWVPSPTSSQGLMQFLENATRDAQGAGTTPGTWSGTHYSGPIGSGDLSPGSVDLWLDWTYDTTNNRVWQFSGNWQGVQSDTSGTHGTVAGTITGTWDSVTGTLTGDVILTDATGRWAGMTGAGTIVDASGVGSPLGDMPPQNFVAGWKIKVFRSL